MLGLEETLVSLALHELTDNEYSDNIKRGGYWELMKQICKVEDDQACYANILDSFTNLKSESNEKLVFVVSALNVFIQNNIQLFSKMAMLVLARNFEKEFIIKT